MFQHNRSSEVRDRASLSAGQNGANTHTHTHNLGVMAHTFSPSFQKAEQAYFYEFKASMAYITSFRPARVT